MKFARVALAVALAVGLAVTGTGAFAQAAWPDKPITMIVPFPPGGGADTVARPVAEALSREPKQPVVIENKASAGESQAGPMPPQRCADGDSTVNAIGTSFQSHRVKAEAPIPDGPSKARVPDPRWSMTKRASRFRRRQRPGAAVQPTDLRHQRLPGRLRQAAHRRIRVDPLGQVADSGAALRRRHPEPAGCLGRSRPGHPPAPRDAGQDA